MKCPKCGSEDIDEIESWLEDDSPVPKYRCNLCKFEGYREDFETWKEEVLEWLRLWKKGAEDEIGCVMRLADLAEESDSLEEFKEKAVSYIGRLTWFRETVDAVLSTMLLEIEKD